MAASEIAKEMGLICSFMPKPFANRTGNGMHIHMSISGEKICLPMTAIHGVGTFKTGLSLLGGLLAPANCHLCTDG